MNIYLSIGIQTISKIYKNNLRLLQQTKADSLYRNSLTHPGMERFSSTSSQAEVKVLRWPLQMFQETSLRVCHHLHPPKGTTKINTTKIRNIARLALTVFRTDGTKFKRLSH